MANAEGIFTKTIQGNKIALIFIDNLDGSFDMSVDLNPPAGSPGTPALIVPASPLKVAGTSGGGAANKIVGLLVPSNLVEVDDIAQVIELVQAQGQFLFNSPDDGTPCVLIFQNNGVQCFLQSQTLGGVIVTAFLDQSFNIVWETETAGVGAMHIPRPRLGSIFGAQASFSDFPAGGSITTASIRQPPARP